MDHSVRSSRIVLEKKNSAKSLNLTGLEPSTHDLSIVLTSCSHALPTVLDPIA